MAKNRKANGTLGRVRSAVITGVQATVVTVEVHRGDGIPDTRIVGLAGAAVRESLDRIRTACKESGFHLEGRKTIVNLAPASHRKSGAGLDLPIALGMLLADRKIEGDRLRNCICLGELGLDGSVRPVAGALPAAIEARRAGYSSLIVPGKNVPEAAAISDIRAIPVSSLKDAVDFTRGSFRPCPVAAEQKTPETAGTDLAEIAGQRLPRRAVELAAAGGHHLLMVGPPGAGKTLLARALPGILPPLSFEETIETSAVYSVVGRLAGHGLLRSRPFRAPHHSVTMAGLIGGGVPPRPGDVSLAHNGVLFLDELPEFRRRPLEALRQPLEEGALVLVRGGQSVRMPARFQLVAAMNPCPCGRGSTDETCRCGERQVFAYWKRISGPLLDRIDMVVGVERVPLDLLTGIVEDDTSEIVRERVITTRQRQAERLTLLAREYDAVPPGSSNAVLPASWLPKACALPRRLEKRAKATAEALRLSARAWHRVLRVARTVADLEGCEAMAAEHLDEAFQYRQRLEPLEESGADAIDAR